MLIPGTIIKSKFKTQNEGHYYCEIKSYQEGTSCLAEGYFVKIKEIKNDIIIFLNKRVVDELYEVVEEKMDEEVFKVNDNGQISFI